MAGQENDVLNFRICLVAIFVYVIREMLVVLLSWIQKSNYVFNFGISMVYVYLDKNKRLQKCKP